VHELAAPTDVLVFAQGFPAGYLFSAAPSATPSAWLRLPATDPSVTAWYRQSGPYPTLVFAFSAAKGQAPSLGNPGGYYPVRHRLAYTVFRWSPVGP